MTLDNKTLLDELFQRYGHPSQEADFRITCYFQKAESLNKSADVQREDKRAAQMIEELSHKINQLTAYRLSLTERYNFLETALTVPVVRLIRERDYYNKKVHYYLCTLRRFVDSGIDVEKAADNIPAQNGAAQSKTFTHTRNPISVLSLKWILKNSAGKNKRIRHPRQAVTGCRGCLIRKLFFQRHFAGCGNGFARVCCRLG